ncbi:hypothetical protein QBC47DRAFT_217051 [Echria macrotheca]|uniref:RING-type domain-containing protein n=1 Tax=Echria macrotheca TaxID=438768 RepID=A0AAJ0BAB8_9PEZI|nr:hypothetical protein QBC47DRAFT_217051 [Echria macrotheca]
MATNDFPKLVNRAKGKQRVADNATEDPDVSVEIPVQPAVSAPQLVDTAPDEVEDEMPRFLDEVSQRLEEAVQVVDFADRLAPPVRKSRGLLFDESRSPSEESLSADAREASVARPVVTLKLPTRECVACTETLDITAFGKRRYTEGCTHKPSTCLACVSAWLRAKMDVTFWKDLNCPECEQILAAKDIEHFADSETWERYRRYMMGTPSNWKKRLDQEVKENEASADTVRKTTRPCPGCKAPVEKRGGCSLMTCTLCGQDFCWDCAVAPAALSANGSLRRGDRRYHAPTCAWNHDSDSDSEL